MDPVNVDQIGKQHGKKIYRCIANGCNGILEEYLRSEEEKKVSNELQINCERVFSQIDECLQVLDEGDWHQQEKIIKEKKKIILQQQIEMAQNNANNNTNNNCNNNKDIEIYNQKLYNVYYSLERKIIKKIFKERKNYKTLFAMNKSDLHLAISEKLRNSTKNINMKKNLIEEKIKMLKIMLENRNLYQAWSNEDYSRLFAEQKNQKNS